MNITLYTVIGDFGRVREAVARNFAGKLKRIEDLEDVSGANAFQIIFRDDTWIKFYVNCQCGSIL